MDAHDFGEFWVSACGQMPNAPSPGLCPAAQLMKWTPPGDFNGIEVPKSSRSVLRNQTSGGVPCRIRPSRSMWRSPFLKLESLIVLVMSTSTTGCLEISCPSFLQVNRPQPWSWKPAVRLIIGRGSSCVLGTM